MFKKITNILIFVFIAALYVISFLMLFEHFKQRKLEGLEKSALDTFEKTVKIEKTKVDDLDNDKTSNMGFDYSGYTLLGKLSIPKINFNAVVIKENTYHAMDLGVVISYGVSLNEPGGTIISGHNYRGQSVFMYNIKNLNPGDKMYLTDSSGREVEYTVYEKLRNYSPDNTDLYKKYDGYHLILVTCENDGNSRIVVKAVAN
jgi:LPXTG-site transpeptidase (sortase) family protein